MAQQQLLELRQRQALAFDLDHAVEPAEQHEASAGDEICCVVHAPQALGKVGRIEQQRAVLGDVDADAGKGRPGFLQRRTVALPPRDAAGLGAAESLERRGSEAGAIALRGLRIERSAGRKNQLGPAPFAERQEIGKARQVRGRRYQQVPAALCGERAQFDRIGAGGLVGGTRRGEGPQQAEEQAVDVVMRHRRQHAAARDGRAPELVQVLELEVELAEGLVDAFGRAGAARGVEREAAARRFRERKRRVARGGQRFKVCVAQHRDARRGEAGDGFRLQARRDQRLAAALPQREHCSEEEERARAGEHAAGRAALIEPARHRRHAGPQLAPGHRLALRPAEEVLRWQITGERLSDRCEHQRTSGNRRRRSSHSPANSAPIAR